MRFRFLIPPLLAALLLTANASPARADDQRNYNAMWLSIAHPGLGEYYLQGWGPFGTNCPQRKFWLGFIPIYGWPGYLQVKSAIDARNGRTNDELAFRDER